MFAARVRLLPFSVKAMLAHRNSYSNIVFVLLYSASVGSVVPMIVLYIWTLI